PDRPVEIWNSFAGAAPFINLKPVKKFANRKAAVERIWEAVQVLLANVGKPASTTRPRKLMPDKFGSADSGEFEGCLLREMKCKEMYGSQRFLGCSIGRMAAGCKWLLPDR